ILWRLHPLDADNPTLLVLAVDPLLVRFWIAALFLRWECHTPAIGKDHAAVHGTFVSGVAEGKFPLMDRARRRIGQHHAPVASPLVQSREHADKIGVGGYRGEDQPSAKPEHRGRKPVFWQQRKLAGETFQATQHRTPRALEDG